MEINKSGKAPIEPRSSGGSASKLDTARSDARKTQAAAGSEAQGDKVTLTGAAQRLLDMARETEGAPVDQAKVEALRQALADGTYQVDPAKIAQALWRMDNG